MSAGAFRRAAAAPELAPEEREQLLRQAEKIELLYKVSQASAEVESKVRSEHSTIHAGQQTAATATDHVAAETTESHGVAASGAGHGRAETAVGAAHATRH
jgi:hypothetical protein